MALKPCLGPTKPLNSNERDQEVVLTETILNIMLGIRTPTHLVYHRGVTNLRSWKMVTSSLDAPNQSH